MPTYREHAPSSFTAADARYDDHVYGAPDGEPRRSHTAPLLDAESQLAKMRQLLARAEASPDPQSAAMYEQAAISALSHALRPPFDMVGFAEAAMVSADRVGRLMHGRTREASIIRC